MGLHDLLGEKVALGDILRYLAGHVVPLDRVDGGVLVGVLLLGFLVVALNEREDLIVGGVYRPAEIVVIAVADVVLGRLISAGPHELGLYHLLDLFHRGSPPHPEAVGLDFLRNGLDLRLGELRNGRGGPAGLGDGSGDLFPVKQGLGAASLHDLHICARSSYVSIWIARRRPGGLCGP